MAETIEALGGVEQFSNAGLNPLEFDGIGIQAAAPLIPKGWHQIGREASPRVMRAYGFLPRRGLRLTCNPSGVALPSSSIPGVRFATPGYPLLTLRVENACDRDGAGTTDGLEAVAAAPGVLGKPVIPPFPALKGRTTTDLGTPGSVVIGHPRFSRPRAPTRRLPIHAG